MNQADDVSLDDVSLEDLAARAQAGDEGSFAELVTRLRDPLTAFLARRLDAAADADDVAQETFLRAFRHIDRYDPQRRFSTWLFAIGKNVAADHRASDRRRAERARETSDEPVAAAALAGVDALAERDGGALWHAARHVLGDDAYRALWLRYAQDLSVREVAREMGRSVVAIKVMLFRARRKLLDVEVS